MAGHRLGAVEGGGTGYLPPFRCIPAQDFPTLWVQILAAFGTFYKQRPHMSDSIKESIKNMVLVMATCAGSEGYAPPRVARRATDGLGHTWAHPWSGGQGLTSSRRVPASACPAFVFTPALFHWPCLCPTVRFGGQEAGEGSKKAVAKAVTGGWKKRLWVTKWDYGGEQKRLGRNDIPFQWAQSLCNACLPCPCPCPCPVPIFPRSLSRFLPRPLFQPSPFAPSTGDLDPRSKEKPEHQRVFTHYPRFWTITMDELIKHFDFAEQLNEYIRGAFGRLPGTGCTASPTQDVPRGATQTWFTRN